ncbi:radical SAM protein [Geomonas nitrogeniifigens]|uniref:Radical SAM protein n=1 Tax=Geomonas diazotrophica TaxID=2843197 RepID=A0ABX8JSR3_9BACT|nr:radical SAM protein [Geomonas nitrogeniifigens]QWV98445.1 radical SAM protein [Geomonas nitrogeniifigens]QXE87627.1 radical SAM protein [Geomonas nitrogeniifigens]
MRPLLVPFFIPHQGCPHRCVFCDQERVAGVGGGLPTARQLLSRIEEYRLGAPARTLEIAFYGGTFTALPRRDQGALLFPLQPLLAAGVVQSVRLSTRPDAVDPDTAEFLNAHGVATVELGVQSLDPEVLLLSGRGHGASEVEHSVATLKKVGIEVGIQLMPGLPGDTPQAALASLRRALDLKPAFLRIYPTLVIEGTELARRYREGSYHPLDLPQAVTLCKEMLEAAGQAGIPVIRFGLQPTSELDSPGVVVAGPYHPAFGQLVESELCFDRMCGLLEGIPPGSRVSFGAPPGRVSDLVGQRRGNLQRLATCYGVAASVSEDRELLPDVISLQWGELSRHARLFESCPRH